MPDLEATLILGFDDSKAQEGYARTRKNMQAVAEDAAKAGATINRGVIKLITSGTGGYDHVEAMRRNVQSRVKPVEIPVVLKPAGNRKYAPGGSNVLTPGSYSSGINPMEDPMESMNRRRAQFGMTGTYSPRAVVEDDKASRERTRLLDREKRNQDRRERQERAKERAENRPERSLLKAAGAMTFLHGGINLAEFFDKSAEATRHMDIEWTQLQNHFTQGLNFAGLHELPGLIQQAAGEMDKLNAQVLEEAGKQQARFWGPERMLEEAGKVLGLIEKPQDPAIKDKVMQDVLQAALKDQLRLGGQALGAKELAAGGDDLGAHAADIQMRKEEARKRIMSQTLKSTDLKTRDALIAQANKEIDLEDKAHDNKAIREAKVESKRQRAAMLRAMGREGEANSLEDAVKRDEAEKAIRGKTNNPALRDALLLQSDRKITFDRAMKNAEEALARGELPPLHPANVALWGQGGHMAATGKMSAGNFAGLNHMMAAMEHGTSLATLNPNAVHGDILSHRERRNLRNARVAQFGLEEAANRFGISDVAAGDAKRQKDFEKNRARDAEAKKTADVAKKIQHSQAANLAKIAELLGAMPEAPD